MKISAPKDWLKRNPLAEHLVSYLKDNQQQLGLSEASLFINFPVFKFADNHIVSSMVTLVSPFHGVVLLETSPVTCASEVAACDKKLDGLYGAVFSRLERNPAISSKENLLATPLDSILFLPNVTNPRAVSKTESLTCFSLPDVGAALKQLESEPLAPSLVRQILASLDGTKALATQKPRNTTLAGKGSFANEIDTQAFGFDLKQWHGFMTPTDGVQRIRGLAGSGKTVILAMKAALIHLRDPEAKILFTFNTRSLYQHVRRLITRIYRHFEDKDPDFEKIQVLHAWGGRKAWGVYYRASLIHGQEPIPLSAVRNGLNNKFEFVCRKLLHAVENFQPQWDYTFIDEGQDLNAPFVQLCMRLTHHRRVTLAYDNLQTILQERPPEAREVFQDDAARFAQDTVLHHCYRTPREVLVAAVALGFGLYSDRPVQMLQNKEHWEDLGFRVAEGAFQPGEKQVILRPEAHSPSMVSHHYAPEEMVQIRILPDLKAEVDAVVAQIKADLADGLLLQDMVVITVDDRHASDTLQFLQFRLEANEIEVYNTQRDSPKIQDFQSPGCLTVTTAHKAKGNEAMIVYILGIGELFRENTFVPERNKLYVAMTRAKGWVRLFGTGEGAERCKAELDRAMADLPNLVFPYPNEPVLTVVQRDLTQSEAEHQRKQRLIEEVLSAMTPDEIRAFLANAAL